MADRRVSQHAHSAGVETEADRSGPASRWPSSVRDWSLFLIGLGLVFTIGLISGCSSSQPSTAPTSVVPSSAATPVRVLMLTATAGFRHDSIDTARNVMSSLASSSGEFTVTTTEQLSTVNAETLSTYQVLFFAL